jgi:LuxR family maltose regulon positive regulatory protein
LGAITVVHGLQGYGKTAFVGGWLRDQPSSTRTIWLALGEDGRDSAESFFQQLSDALRDSRLVADVRAHPLESLNRVSSFLEQDERLIVVIDNAHRLRSRSALRRLSEIMARHPRLHLIMCSRGHHAIEQIAAGVVDVVVIPSKELLFSRADVELLARRLGVSISASQLDQLHKASAGWPAIVRLVLEASEDGHALGMSRGVQYVRDTVMAGWDDREIAGILSLVLPDDPTHKLIHDLSSRSTGPSTMQIIEDAGLVERQYVGNDIVLHVPELVRRAVRDQAEARAPSDVRHVHQELSRWFMRRFGPRDQLLALRHAIAGEAWDQVDAIWLDHSSQIVANVHPHETWAVLRTVPEEILKARPGLDVGRRVAEAAAAALDWSADGHMTTLRAYARASMRLAARGLGQMDLHDLLYVGTGKVVGLRLSGRLWDAVRIGDEIQRRSNQLLLAGRSPGDRLGWFHVQRGITHMLRDEMAEAMHCHRIGWQHRAGSAHVSAMAAANLAVIHAVSGRRTEARRWLDRYAQTEVESHLANQTADTEAKLAAGILALDRLEVDGCRTAVEALGDGSAPSEIWRHIVWLNAEYGLQFSTPASALARMVAAERAHAPRGAPTPIAKGMLAAARANLLIAVGQAHRAYKALVSEDWKHDAWVTVSLVRLHLSAGDPYEARRAATQVLWSEGIGERMRLDLLLLSALATYRMDDLQHAKLFVRQAMALYTETRLLRPFSLLPQRELSKLFDVAGDGLDGDDLAVIRRHTSPYPVRLDTVHLTPREQLIVSALTRTATRQQIADELSVSVNTVRKQLATLYRKLGVRTKAEAMMRLTELGLICGESTDSRNEVRE